MVPLLSNTKVHITKLCVKSLVKLIQHKRSFILDLSHTKEFTNSVIKCKIRS